MNLVDSSGWLAYLTDGHNSDFFAKAILGTEEIVVPTIVFYEIFKKTLSDKGEEFALQTIGQLHKYTVVDLDEDLSLSAARISHERKIPMADSIIYATANKFGATIWTQDKDFKDLPNVKYVQRKR